MDRKFAAFTLDEFSDALDRFPFSRRIDAVHMHHTWRPNHSQWRGEPSVVAMWRFHTETNGWSDIAQHVTIAPDGRIWEGRDWNLRPASASGHNGSGTAGPFMFEIVGDFDVGRDALSGPQRAAVVGVIARVLQRFGLGPESLHFHREMTTLKTCPGTSVELEEIRAEVEMARAALSGATRVRSEPSRAGRAGRPRTPARTRVPATRRRSGGKAGAREPDDAEPGESILDEEAWRELVGARAPGQRRAARAVRGRRRKPRKKASAAVRGARTGSAPRKPIAGARARTRSRRTTRRR
jgi:N-acetylmuramoyl-L-alanine amidase